MVKTYGKVHKLASMVNLSINANHADNALAVALRAALPTSKTTRNKKGQFTPLVYATCAADRISARDSIELLADVATKSLGDATKNLR